jgi:hypothetical protein
MMRDKRFILIFLTLGLPLFVYALTFSEQKYQLTDRLTSLSGNAPPELAYIQTDKEIYESGEVLWFKVYLLDAKFLTPSARSKTLYLQLLNENNKRVVWQEKYEIQKGFANGSLTLESTLPEGNYLLAAYTANSFFDNITEFKAIKKVIIKSVTKYMPSFIAKFDKPFYSGKDTIKISLAPGSPLNDSIFAEISSSIQQGNKKLSKVQAITNSQGKAIISFLPQDTRKELTVSINTKYKNQTESLIMPVPGKGNPTQFLTFPEGGYMVSGIQSKLAFKAVNCNGDPLDITGSLFEDGTPILKFKSMHAGMGSFDFIPKAGKKYFIRLSDPAIDSMFFLPEIYPTGIIMSLVKRDNNSISFKVSASQGFEGEDIYIRVQCRGVVCGITTAKLAKELIVKIPLEGLPQGIIELTLFNSRLVPVTERLVYVNPERKLNIRAELSKDIYPTRGKATLKITLKDENGQPVIANLGVSVFDKHYQNTLDSGNILSYVYLSAQIRGRIFNPAYYFNENISGRYEALDLLMLTQGWRKYIWSERNMLKFVNVPKHIISDGINGNITIQSLWKKVKMGQKFAFAYSPDKDQSNVIIPADSSGRFTVFPDLLKRWEGDYVYLKPMGPSDSYPFIKLTNPFDSINLVMRTEEISYPIPDLMKPTEEISYIPEVIPGTITIKEVTIKGSKRNLQNGIRGNYMEKLANSDYVCVNNVLNCPRHVYGIDFRRPKIGETYFVMHNFNFKSEYVEPIRYDSTFFKSPLYSSIKISHNFSEEELLKLNNLVRVKAYEESREFYMPDYDKVTEDAIIPDYRNTLLWNPAVLTDNNGEATLSFFCSDINSEFTGRIEGVSNDGLLGTGTFRFTVRKLDIPVK